MVEQAGCYYVNPLNSHKGFTQGISLYPTIFNMVVDAIDDNYQVITLFSPW